MNFKSFLSLLPPRVILLLKRCHSLFKVVFPLVWSDLEQYSLLVTVVVVVSGCWHLSTKFSKNGVEKENLEALCVCRADVSSLFLESTDQQRFNGSFLLFSIANTHIFQNLRLFIKSLTSFNFIFFELRAGQLLEPNAKSSYTTTVLCAFSTGLSTLATFTFSPSERSTMRPSIFFQEFFSSSCRQVVHRIKTAKRGREGRTLFEKWNSMRFVYSPYYYSSQSNCFTDAKQTPQVF